MGIQPDNKQVGKNGKYRVTNQVIPAINKWARMVSVGLSTK
jgi:hypothetical protein